MLFANAITNSDQSVDSRRYERAVAIERILDGMISMQVRKSMKTYMAEKRIVDECLRRREASIDPRLKRYAAYLCVLLSLLSLSTRTVFDYGYFRPRSMFFQQDESEAPELDTELNLSFLFACGTECMIIR